MGIETRHFCDLCGDIIRHYSRSPGTMMIHMRASDWQAWPGKDRVWEICSNCCIRLQKAADMGIIESISQRALCAAAGLIEVEPGKWQVSEGNFTYDETWKPEEPCPTPTD